MSVKLFIIRFIFFLTVFFISLNSHAEPENSIVPIYSNTASLPLETKPISATDNFARFTFSQLTATDEVVLTGLNPSYLLYIPIPLKWNLIAAKLHLILTHSPILSKISTLTVLVNNIPIDTIRLIPENSNETAWDITLPTNLLNKPAITLKFTGFMQITTDPCVDIENFGNWLRISPDSSMDFSFTRRDFQPLLTNFPFPFVNPQAIEKDAVSIITANNPSMQELIPAFQLTRILGFNTSWRGLRLNFTKLDDVNKNNNTNLILVGSTQKIFPLLKKYSAFLPLKLTENGVLLKQNGEKITPETGVLMIINSPLNPHYVWLVVTGVTDKAVMNAASFLQNSNFVKLIHNNYALISNDVIIEPAPTSLIDWKSTTLAKLGYSDLTIFGEGQNNINYNINLPANRTPEFVKFKIVYSYSPFIYPEHSYLILSVNGVPQDGIRLDLRDTTRALWETVIQKEALVPGKNAINFLFDLGLREKECNRLRLSKAWGTVHASTQVEVGFGTQPPIITLKQFPAPFDANSLIVLPIQAEVDEQTAIGNFLALFGKQIGNNPNSINLTTADVATEDLLKKNDIILIGQANNNRWLADLLNRVPLNLQGNLLNFHNLDSKFTAVNDQPIGVIQKINSPWNKNKTLLIITGTNSKVTSMAMNLLTDEKLRKGLDGEIAIIDSTGNLSVINLHTFQQLDHSTLTPRFQILNLVIILLFGMVVIIFARNLFYIHHA